MHSFSSEDAARIAELRRPAACNENWRVNRFSISHRLGLLSTVTMDRSTRGIFVTARMVLAFVTVPVHLVYVIIAVRTPRALL